MLYLIVQLHVLFCKPQHLRLSGRLIVEFESLLVETETCECSDSAAAGKEAETNRLASVKLQRIFFKKIRLMVAELLPHQTVLN